MTPRPHYLVLEPHSGMQAAYQANFREHESVFFDSHEDALRHLDENPGKTQLVIAKIATPSPASNSSRNAKPEKFQSLGTPLTKT